MTNYSNTNFSTNLSASQQQLNSICNSVVSTFKDLLKKINDNRQ